MVSKKNKNFYLRKSAKKVSKYAIKKLSVGVASVLLSTAFFMGSTSGVKASADVTETATEVLADSTAASEAVSSDGEDESASAETPATSEAISNEEATVVADSSASEQAQSEAVQEEATSSAATSAAISESASSEATSEAQSEAPVQVASEESATSEAPASQATPALATTSEASQAEVAKTQATDTNVDSQQASVATEAEETQTAPASENDTAVFRSVGATTRAAADSTASDETTVNSWSQLVSAMRNSSVTNIKVTGSITALGSGNIGSTGHKVVVKGENAKLSLGTNTLVATGSGWDITFDGLTITTGNSKGVIDLSNSYGSNKVTFKDVTQSGTSLYGGGGNTEVIIDGTTTSTVNNASAGKANTYNATSREANIHSATKVTVAEGANFTLNRSSIGDAINLPNGSTVEVKDKGTLTINMNTSNATDSARYHNAGIFMLGGGTVKTGKNSTLNINSSIGQAISIAITRPADTATDADRYGGYDISHSTTVNDENTTKKGGMQDGPVVISIGEDANFNFTGRDGIITGHNATFTTGEGSVTHFKNNGRGVAIDMGDNSHIKFSKRSINTFESDGKGPRKGAMGPSGGYAGYNYIGVDEGGTITVDDYATFRVYMNNRGANPWDDVISLDTRKVGGYPLFVVNKGAIVDIRDDNTDYYAELISIPLGSAQNTGYQFNSPLFVSFQRYTSSNGWVSSDITGKLPENVPQGNNPEPITRASSNILYVSNKAATGSTYLEFNALENGGTYTVYSLNIGNAAQKDVNKQSSVWTNINSGKFSIWGFQNNKKDITPADALSEQTGSSTGGVPATSKQGLYDIDPILKNRQNVWIPNETVISPEAHHTNTIKYVYEDGSPVLDENGNPIVSVQSSDWERTMKIKLALEDFRKKLRANSVRTADEFLRVYNQALYELGTAAGDDTGWVVKGTENTKATYDTVVSPKADRAGNYVLTVKDTNADGVTVGANGSSVTAILNKDNITDTLTSDLNGAKVVSQSYWKNFSNVGFTKDYVTTVVYKKISTQVLTYTVIDDTTKTTLVDAAKLAEGDSSSAVPASVATSYQAIQKSYTDKGYVVKSADALPTTFDDDDAVNQNVTIHLEHATVPVTPENPQTPGTPINPNDPDGPKWPAGTDKDSLQKAVKETVHYVGAGSQTPADNVQNATYTKSVTVDKVTGEIVSQTDWTPDKQNYDEVKTPVITGYYADKATVPSTAVVQNDIEETVTYKPLGHIVPVDPEGNPIPGADTPIYENNPNDPTKVIPGQKVPEIPGYTPQVPTVTPEDPGADTKVVYVKDVDQVAKVTYIDDTTNKTLETADLNGQAGTTSSYRTNDTITKYLAKGYELVSDNYPANGVVFDDDNNTVQSFEVHLKHGTVPVTPENPQTPGTPINPNDPDGPKWPDGTDKDSLQKVVKETVHYVGAGDKTPADNVQNATYTKSVTVDKVTGEIVSQTDWTPDKQNYDEVKTPVITGYYADKATVPSTAVVQNDIEETVTYKELGHIVPVDPDGNPIPGADTPIYNNDPTDPTKVVPNQPVPEIPGYTPQVPTVTPNDPGADTKVVYVKDVDQVAKVTYIDDTTNKTLETADLTGQAGATSDYRTADTIAKYLAQGYELVSNNYPANGVVFDDDDNTVQSFEVHLKHGTVPVTPENPQTPGTPINPDDPDGPKWPSGTDKDSLQKVVKETVHYVGAGDKTPADNVQNATYTKSVTVDKVTGEIVSQTDWTPDKQNYDEVKTPVITGYYADKATVPSTAVVQNDIEETVTYKELGHIVPVDPDGNPIPGADTPIYNNDPSDPTKVVPNQPVPEIPGYTPQVPTVTPDDPGTDTKVVYVKDADQVAKVTYIDDTTNKTLETADLTGQAGATSDYRTNDTIAKYLAKGYELVSNNYPANGVVFDNDDNTVQSFEVHLKHAVAPVGPNDPHTPGTPINPDNPDGPKWPSADQYTKEYTSTVHFVDEAGNKVFDDNTQTSTWTRTLLVDKVTGEVQNPDEPWTADKAQYDAVTVPVKEDYYADKNRVVAKDTVQKDLEETVVYKPLGHIVPVDKDGNEIPKAPTPEYNNDPNDPTKGTTTPVPDIPGYHPEVPSVTPTDPGKDTPVVYVKDEDPVKPDPTENDQKATIIYRDITTDTVLDSVSLTGKSETAINYSTADKIKELTDKGYVLVNDGFPSDATFDNNDDVDQTYYVTVKHGEEPVGPNNPHEPGTPINPNDPDGPKWPSTDEYSKEYTSTVHFVDENGNKVFDDDVQTSTWTRTLIIDTVTGEIKNPQESWKADKDKYSDVLAPILPKYYADKNRVVGQVTEQSNLEDTITYKPLGHIVPVDEDGNEIPKAPTPQYNNDPTDPTKGGSTPVPDIPGYHPEVPSVTPTDPGADTPVKYIKDKDPEKPTTPSENDQKATIIYRDLTTDTILDSASVTGKPNTAIEYSTAATIKELTDKGYVLVNDGFPSDATFDNNDNVDQTYYVTVKHGEEPVGPNNPHEPGTPINPNDPDGPKWPSTDEYSKEYSSTVHFVDENGNKVFDDNVQTSTWTRTLIIDTVTGEVKNPQETWKADKDKYASVNAPVKEDYYADKASVAAKDVVQDNLEDTIVYKPLGHIVPVDPDGNPIPNAPTPEYNNDPKDPTKGGETPVPNIPGYHPEVPSVTPNKPGEDTPVKYIKDAVNYSLTEKFVDENGNELSPTVIKGSEYKQGDSYDVSSDAKVIKGYYLKAVSDNAKGTFGEADVTVTFTYAKLGNIVPVDPSGTPIPDAPTPPYKNDPNDPTKGGETPVPVIPGYKPEVPSVTPDKPGEDTPVIYVPVTPEKDAQAVRIIYRDITNDMVLDSVDLSGKAGEKVEYSTAAKIKELTDKGYVLVNDGFPSDAVFDDDANVDQTYYVTLKHGEEPVGPNNPHEPGTPINPNDPDGPKWPSTDQYTKEYTSTVQFVDDKGNKLRDDDVQTSTWTRTLLIDTVTGEIKNPTEPWTSDIAKYADVTAPVINNYYADKSRVTGKTAVEENLVEQIVYKPLGHIVPVDPEGNPIPGVDTPQFNNDPNDPTKGGTTPVPEIPDYTPRVPSVTPENPGKDVPVIYDKKEDPNKPDIPNDHKQLAKVIYRDITTDTDLVTDKLTGEAGAKLDYSTTVTIKQLTDKGYVLVSDGFPSDAVFDDDANVDQTYYVTFKHGEEPVGPDNPHEPGTPINPNDPDGPKWPSKDEYSKEYTSTVHFVDKDGNKLRDDNVQTSTWTRTLIIDTVTGEVKNPNEAWKADKANYDEVAAPVITGYYADKDKVAGLETVQNNLENSIIYSKLGNIVPVDPSGNPIPNAPTPSYNNDPKDPTKGGETPVPEIPGYKPQVPNVTPEDPGKDTPVVYVPVTPEKQTQTAKVIYVDETTGKTLETDVVTGKSGDKIEYSTATKIKQLEEKGYVVVEDGFPTNAIFDDDDAKDQVYVVKLGHGTAPVGPNDPHEPGTPINPNDPNGPKWPAKDEYSKQYSSTVHFVDENGNKLRDDDVQTSTWTRTLIIDKVTGEVLNPSEAWTADKANYAQVKVPVITGYVADKAVVPAQATQQQDLETTVTYKRIGVIVPVDPAGNPIPGAPTPQYKNDPNDPTKVVVTATPDVPGYNTDTPSVDPADPTANTQVVYKKIETPAEPAQPAKPTPTAQPEAKRPVVEPAATKTQPKQDTPAKNVEELPQTGDSENNALAALGATMVASLLGLVGLKKRRKDEQDS